MSERVADRISQPSVRICHAVDTRTEADSHWDRILTHLSVDGSAPSETLNRSTETLNRFSVWYQEKDDNFIWR